MPESQNTHSVKRLPETGSEVDEPLHQYIDLDTYGVVPQEVLDEAKTQNGRLRGALLELLDVAERIRGGDTKLDPERWYAARDFARIVLAETSGEAKP